MLNRINSKFHTVCLIEHTPYTYHSMDSHGYSWSTRVSYRNTQLSNQQLSQFPAPAGGENCLLQSWRIGIQSTMNLLSCLTMLSLVMLSCLTTSRTTGPTWSNSSLPPSCSWEIHESLCRPVSCGRSVAVFSDQCHPPVVSSAIDLWTIKNWPSLWAWWSTMVDQILCLF